MTGAGDRGLDRPNVLLVVLDACRLDAARGYAPRLGALAADNLWFDNAITPAGYSLPSHVSFLTGEYPHEHGVYSPEHWIDRAPLLEGLAERGYRRYGVSANGFASGMYGFDREFDEFYSTQAQIPYPEGLDVIALSRRGPSDDDRPESGGGPAGGDAEGRGPSAGRPAGGSERPELRTLLAEVLGHDHPLKSACNVAGAGLTELVRSYPVLRRIPHRRFSRHAEFAYSPARNTRTICDILERAADREEPFFLFANYMDAHHPYAPPRDQQRAFCGRTFSNAELRELADLTHPLDYLQRQANGETLDASTRATLRNLYLGEVRTADDHLGRLLAALEATGLREETVVVVTADHGENLGERDALGERRFGHILSASDNLLRVPLVVAHPRLEGRRVDRYVSTKDLFGFCLDPGPTLVSGGRSLGALGPDGPVAAQLPAYLDDALEAAYPELRELLARHVAVVFGDGWKVVDMSTGTRRAFRGRTAHPVEAAPESLRTVCREHRRSLEALAPAGRELGAEERRRLEALGYL